MSIYLCISQQKICPKGELYFNHWCQTNIKERERERERQRETEIQRDREKTERQRDKERETDTKRYRERKSLLFASLPKS